MLQDEDVNYDSSTICVLAQHLPSFLHSFLPIFTGLGGFFSFPPYMAARNDEQHADSWHLPGESAWHGRSCPAQNNKRGAKNAEWKGQNNPQCFVLVCLDFFLCVCVCFIFSLWMVASSRQICFFSVKIKPHQHFHRTTFTSGKLLFFFSAFLTCSKFPTVLQCKQEEKRFLGRFSWANIKRILFLTSGEIVSARNGV